MAWGPKMKKTPHLIDFISLILSYEEGWKKLIKFFYSCDISIIIETDRINDWKLVHLHSHNNNQILPLLRNLPNVAHRSSSVDGVQRILKGIHTVDYFNLHDGSWYVNFILRSLIRFLGDGTGNYWGSLWNKADIIILGLLTVLFIFETLFTSMH